MYKLQVRSGIGDCLRIINDCRIIARCLKEQRRCFVNYKVVPEKPWTYRNKQTFLDLIKGIDLFEYMDDEDFNKCDFENASPLNRTAFVHEKILPLPIKFSDSSLEIFKSIDSSKINIAFHIAGSCRRKRYSMDQIQSIFSAFKDESINFHIIDYPAQYENNKKLFSDFSNVFCRQTTLNENYKIITLCDLLLGPDSFSKYVGLAADIKMVLVCSKLPYIADINDMFKWFFDGITNNSKVSILGWKNEEELVDEISDFPVEKIIEAMQNLLGIKTT